MSLSTTERRARFWLLMNRLFQEHAAKAKTDAIRDLWLKRAAVALETAASAC